MPVAEWHPMIEVMAGSTSWSGLKRFLMESVCHALVMHAPCKVEVVKAPLNEGE